MDINDIDAVLAVSGTLESHGYSDAAHTPGLIADLFRWADSRASQLAAGNSDSDVMATVVDKPRGKRAKATESKDSDFEPTPDPSSDDEPDF